MELEKFTEKKFTKKNHDQRSKRTIEEALPLAVSAERPLSSLLSDHGPRFHRDESMIALSWNVLGENLFVGFSNEGGTKAASENQQEYAIRQKNINKSIIQIIKSREINIIALQEAHPDFSSA